MSASGSRMLQEHPVVFQGVTSPIQAACTCVIQAEHILSPLLESLMMLTSILFCYSDYSGHRLQADSHWVSFVWSLQHFKKFSTCCQQHLKFEQFYVKIQVGNFSCKVRSTTSALILTRWSLAGTESQLCPVEGIRGSWLNHKNPLPAPRGLPHSQCHSFRHLPGSWRAGVWALSLRKSLDMQIQRAQRQESVLPPENRVLSSPAPHPQPAGLGSHSLHVLWPADMLFSLDAILASMMLLAAPSTCHNPQRCSEICPGISIWLHSPFFPNSAVSGSRL